MRPSGGPRQNPFEDYDLTNNGSETDASRLDLYRNSNTGPNLSFMDEPDNLSFGGLSVSMRTENLHNLNIVSQGPPLPQQLRTPPQQSLYPLQDPVFAEEQARPLRPKSLSNLRTGPPPSLMGVGGGLDSQMPYHPASVNSSPRVTMPHYSPAMGHSPMGGVGGMMAPEPPPPPPLNRYSAPRPVYDRYNIQVPDDFASYNHVFASSSRGGVPGTAGVGGGMYHVTPPSAYSPPPQQYSNTPPHSYRPTPRFVPPLVENHNLHYRPNREQQLANLAKQKAAAAAAAATNGGTGSGSNSAESSPMTSSKEVGAAPPLLSAAIYGAAVATAAAASAAGGGGTAGGGGGVMPMTLSAGSHSTSSVSLKTSSSSPVPSPHVDSRKVADKKDIVVYMVKFKISTMYCVVGPKALNVALNDQVVVTVEAGEDIGTVNSILSLNYFMEQFELTSEEETLMAMKCIVRLASEKERGDLLKNASDEARLVEAITELNRQKYQFPITIFDTEYQADRKKLTIYYDTLESGATVDIKELLKGVYPLVQTKVSCKKIANKSPKHGGGGSGSGNGGSTATTSNNSSSITGSSNSSMAGLVAGMPSSAGGVGSTAGTGNNSNSMSSGGGGGGPR